jgi:hypothetical protein
VPAFPAFACATLVALAVTPSGGGAASVPVAPLDSVLIRFVREGRVDYRGLARDPGSLRRFLDSTREARPPGHPRAEQIAFWVNAYNARVLDGVIRRPGLASVLDPGKVAGVPTLGFFRERRRTAGRMLSLNDIEHEILRAGFREPRIHFVLNCASVSCPVFPERALTGATLEATLDAATRRFLADRTKNRLAADGRLELSSIFKWYEEDFRSAAGSVPAFVARYWPAPGRVTATTTLRVLDYDWSLNGSWE